MPSNCDDCVVLMIRPCSTSCLEIGGAKRVCLFVSRYPILPEIIRNRDGRSSAALVDENVLFSGLSRQSDRTANTNQRMGREENRLKSKIVEC